MKSAVLTKCTLLKVPLGINLEPCVFWVQYDTAIRSKLPTGSRFGPEKRQNCGRSERALARRRGEGEGERGGRTDVFGGL